MGQVEVKKGSKWKGMRGVGGERRGGEGKGRGRGYLCL